jgi:hypothetical protein
MTATISSSPVRLAAFGSLFAALLVVLALAVPLPLGPSPVVGGQPPRRDTKPVCLALSYDAMPDTRELPASVRLLPEPEPGQGWYRAFGGPDPDRLYRSAWWRPAGPDSIDIGWHHSPVLRLPSRPDSVVGRVIPAYVSSFIAFVLEAREFPVYAVRVPC